MRLYLLATAVAAICLSFATAGSAGTYNSAGYYGSYSKQCMTKRVKTRDYTGKWVVKRVRICK